MDSEPVLLSLSGNELQSEFQPGVRYRLDRALGAGATGVAFLAVRDAPEGLAPVVIKVVRPSVAAAAEGRATTLVRKEVVALARLNEHVPQTPFVVRFIDTGSAQAAGTSVFLPWIAIEHVHGGVEGTTLEERVRYSVENTGFAFDPGRAAHALRSLGAGLAAVHAVGVIHRDLTPGNVLCCGFGEFELFKISDFGLSRMQSLETFGRVLLGTPAYTAPEQNFPEAVGVGPHSDVYSLGCLAHYLLTGQPYFDAVNMPQALMAARSPARKSILASAALAPELRADPQTSATIDAILARATANDPATRPAHAQELTSALAHCLSAVSGGEPVRASRRLVQSVLRLASPVAVSGWEWRLRHPPGDDVVLHSVAWESDGHCLAASTDGLRYWSGTIWSRVSTGPLAQHVQLRAVHRVRAGTWVIGGEDVVAVCSPDGVEEAIQGPGARFQHLSGHPDELLVAVSDGHGARPELWVLSGRRWLAPLPLGELASVSAMARVRPTEWLIAGRTVEGVGALGLCRPLERAIRWLAIPRARAIVACTSQPDRELGLAVGTDGVSVSVHPGGESASVLDQKPDLSACAVDILDRKWAGAAGRLWVKEPRADAGWRLVWEDRAVTSPFVGILADVGMVLGVTADGGVVEGRAPWTT